MWFSDGNVDIVAQDTVFRVHEGILSRHSTVFPEMFAGAAREVTVDRVAATLRGGGGNARQNPVVRVSDSAHDFKHLLRILYDGFE